VDRVLPWVPARILHGRCNFHSCQDTTHDDSVFVSGNRAVSYDGFRWDREGTPAPVRVSVRVSASASTSSSDMPRPGHTISTIPFI
jgi:hypothetical protein